MLAMSDYKLADNKMDQVLELTRSGRLADATALLQGRLVGSASASKRTPSPLNIDLVQPQLAGGTWTIELDKKFSAPMKADSARQTDQEAAHPGSFEYRIVTNAAGTRRYKLYVPKHYDGTPMPLVVMLHGCTQSPEDFALGTRMNVVADEIGVIVAYPEQRQSANSSKCWNWFKPGDQRRDEGEPSIIADMVRQIRREMAVETGKIFLAGLSAGGAAAAVLAQTYPDLFAGVCVHSGLACGAAHDMPSAFAAMRGGSPARKAPAGAPRVPTIVFHGTADRTVHPDNALHVVATEIRGLSVPDVVEGRSAGGVSYTRTTYRNLDRRPAVEVWMLDGAGHAWAGGSEAGSYTDPRCPDASREMMRFFLSL